MRAAIADGYAAPSTTVLDGRSVVRLCTINPRTTEREVEGLVDAVIRLGDEETARERG